MIELIIITLVVIFIAAYRTQQGSNMYGFVVNQVGFVYEKYAPYSFKEVRAKTKELGQEYSVRDYTIQIIAVAGILGIVSYLYLYSIFFTTLYVIGGVLIIPYISYLRCRKVFNEFIFEQMQVYTTNVIMEYATTQSFVRALEEIVKTGVLEEPVLSDVKHMIALSYENGNIDESINFFNRKYDYYIVKNMHQLFLQVTNEGSQDSSAALEVMLNDIDMLVSAVYIDKINRKNFQRQFLTFGVMLYFMIGLVQLLVGVETYLNLLNFWPIVIMLNFIILLNSWFLLMGEKYYYEDVGAE